MDVNAELPGLAWTLVAAPDDHPHDLWMLGADLEPGTLVRAYRNGLFPMPVQGRLGWWSPRARAVVPLASFKPSRSIRRARNAFEIRVDTSFAEVVRGCADPRRPHGWIDERFVAAYTVLHELGQAHSIEAWDDRGLAGGLYGVAIGGLFAAESMFHARANASKAAFAGLVELLVDAGSVEHRLLDVQWLTPYLASLGAVEITRAAYATLLRRTLDLSDPFPTSSSHLLGT